MSCLLRNSISLFLFFNNSVVLIFFYIFVGQSDCDIEIMCYGFDEADNSGHLKINGTTFATFGTPPSTTRRKRQMNYDDGWHLFSIVSSCTVSEEDHLQVPNTPEGTNSLLTNFNTFFQVRDKLILIQSTNSRIYHI